MESTPPQPSLPEPGGLRAASAGTIHIQLPHAQVRVSKAGPGMCSFLTRSLECRSPVRAEFFPAVVLNPQNCLLPRKMSEVLS